MSSTWFHLKHRTVLKISGEDRVKFLQGLVTNDVMLSDSKAIYSLLLSPQGRFQHDFFIAQDHQGVLFLTPETNRVEDLENKLNLYKLKAAVQIENLSDSYFLLWQPHESRNERGTVLEDTIPIVFIDPRITEMGIYSIAQKFAPVADGLSQYQEKRIRLGIPDGSQDMLPDKAIPLENNMDILHAISWTKGCYMGQELTARTKHLGEVRKKLMPVSVKGKMPTFNEPLFFKDKEVGVFKNGFHDIGLALLRLEHVKQYQKQGLTAANGAQVRLMKI